MSKKTGDVASLRAGFAFYGGSAVLDLCATMRGRAKPAPQDLLATPADLSRWLAAAGIVQAPPRATSDDLDAARRLREAIYAISMARIEGDPPPAAARAALNAAAAAPLAALRLGEDGQARLTGGAGAVLASLARDAIHLLGSEKAGRIKQCAAESCSRLFLDISRRGDRRWCSMSSCGNRAKVAEFRRRHGD